MTRYSRRNLYICTGVIVLGLILAVLPAPIGLDWRGAGLGLSALGVFVVILGLIALLLYLRLARAVENMFRKELVLARWNFTPDEWQAYAGDGPLESGEDWKGLFMLVSVLAVILGVVTWLVTRTSAWVVVLMVLGIILLTLLAARLYVRSAHRPARTGGAEVVVSLAGVSINRRIHLWEGIGTRLEKARLEERGVGGSGLIFEYSAPSSSGRDYYAARVPIPAGQKELALQILAAVSARHLAGKPGLDQVGVRQA